MMLLPSRTLRMVSATSFRLSISSPSVALVNNHAFCACHNRRHQRYDALLPVRERFDQLIFHHLIDWEFLFSQAIAASAVLLDIPFSMLK